VRVTLDKQTVEAVVSSLDGERGLAHFALSDLVRAQVESAALLRYITLRRAAITVYWYIRLRVPLDSVLHTSAVLTPLLAARLWPFGCVSIESVLHASAAWHYVLRFGIRCFGG
jgi:hypothetical protein